jgi:hypothetical protein
MNKKQLIVVCLMSILISIIFYGSVYAAPKISPIVKSSYAPNFFDNMLYKKVVLPGANNRPVLVNRLTGEVKYILGNNKRWILLSGAWKNQCQASYDTKVDSKK